MAAKKVSLGTIALAMAALAAIAVTAKWLSPRHPAVAPPATQFGYRPNPERTKKFLSTMRRPMLRDANPDLFRDIKDKKPIFLYRALYEAHRAKFGTDWVVGKQGIGDCFVAGTFVLMADGTRKPIQDVDVGELVVSHMGKSRRVNGTVKKLYSGTLVTMHADEGWIPVTATSDHQFLSSLPPKGMDHVWKSCGQLELGDLLLAHYPKVDKSGVHSWVHAALKKVDTRPVVDEMVYCLGVDGDHSFVANGFAVHNCVSWGWAHGADVHLAVLYKLGLSSEWSPAATEAIYGGSRVEAEGVSFGGWSDGSYGGAAAKWVRDWGILYRQTYPGGVDLLTYSAQRAKDWGAYGCGGKDDRGKLDDVAKKHPIRHVALVTNFEEAAAAISSGYPVPVCSGQGFSSVRDKDGFCRPQGSWSHCLLPGTIVSTLVPKPCEEVMNGDLMVTHKGRLRPVVETMKRHYVGDVIRLRLTGCTDVIATRGHPVLAYRKLVPQEGFAPGVDMATYSGGKFSGKRTQARKQAQEATQPQWMGIENVLPGDYLLTPSDMELPRHECPQWPVNERAVNQPLLITPDDDLAYMFGEYIADGSHIADHRISIVLSEGDDEARLHRAVQKLGLKAWVKDFGTYRRFNVDSCIVANQFREWFGGSSETKHIPEFLLSSQWNLQALLDGYRAGDGTRLKNRMATERHRITTVSPILAHQIWLIAVHLRKYPMMYTISADRPGVYPNAKESVAIEFGAEPKNKTTRYWNGYYCIPVREATSFDYDGPVYNYDVDEDNSYLAGGVAVHNCMTFSSVRFEPRPGLLCQNSWGPDYVSGPKFPEDQPDGSFWVDAATATRMLSGDDSFAVSGIEGFPFRDLDNGDWVMNVPDSDERYVRIKQPDETQFEPVFAVAP